MPVYNPTRRNRNIGTKKSGHGQTNRLNIPGRPGEIFWQRIDGAREVVRTVAHRQVRFFVQSTRSDCVHSCTIDDLATMLSVVPAADWEGIGAIVLRQPTRKQHTLRSVWGRLLYSAELVTGNGQIRYAGPAVMLEALNPSTPIKFGKSLSPADSIELERLLGDGHRLRPNDPHNTLISTLDACRSTQLFRTLPHEIGHWTDYQTFAARCGDSEEGWAYFDRPPSERERYAHDYSQRVTAALAATGRIPFPRITNLQQIEKDGLSATDFFGDCD